MGLRLVAVEGDANPRCGATLAEPTDGPVCRQAAKLRVFADDAIED
jgi:hypothetical protein